MITHDQSAHPQMKAAAFFGWLAAATLLALVLRVICLGTPSFWIDEIYSVTHATNLGTGNITKQFGFVPTYLVLKLTGSLPDAAYASDPSIWQSVGITESLVRLPSVVLGVLSVPILGWLARPIVGSRAAVLFMLILAVNTWHLHMSQTGRFYVQQMLFYNMALLLYYQATTIGSRLKLTLSLICLFLAFMSQPPALMVGIIFGIDWICGVRVRDPKRLTVASCIIGSVFAAICAGLVLYDIKNRPDNWAQFAQTTSQPAKVIIAGAVWYINPAIVLTAFAGFLWLVQREFRLGGYLAIASVLPIAIMGALALGNNFVHVRYTFVALPAWVLLAAVTLDKSTRKSLAEYPIFIRGIPAGLILIACLYQDIGYYTGGGGYRPAWREAFEDLSEMREPDEVIYGDFHARLIGAYYMQEDAVEEVTRGQLMDRLDESETQSWVIDKVGTSGGLTWNKLRGRADLIWTYDRHILQPYSSIKLFKHDPDRDPSLE
ncbi:MAG: hypothetical protein ED559_07245 [Phycisphaera sp.]|nr:MAG: hypothetical protein ED559_07245 [Phycisphaera sp.]